MPELGPSGSARGAVSNYRPYRDREQLQQAASKEATRASLLDHFVGAGERRELPKPRSD